MKSIFTGILAIALANPICLCGAVSTTGHAAEPAEIEHHQHHGPGPCEKEGEPHDCDRSFSGTRDVAPETAAAPPIPETGILDSDTVHAPPLVESVFEEAPPPVHPPDNWLHTPGLTGVFQL